MLFSHLESYYIPRLIIWKGEAWVMSTDRYHLFYAVGKDDYLPLS